MVYGCAPLRLSRITVRPSCPPDAQTYGMIVADNGTNWYITGRRTAGGTQRPEPLKSVAGLGVSTS